ncbi:MAG: hypothetical protein AB7O77_11855 [Phycisphaerales bacterium]
MMVLIPAAANAQTSHFMDLGSLSGPSPQAAANGVSANGLVVVGTSVGRAFRLTAGTGMQDLGHLPAPFNDFSYATSASGDGSVVVGSDTDFAQKQYPEYAFRWGATTGLEGLGQQPPLGALRGSRALAISADGLSIVGSMEEYETGGVRPYLWRAATGFSFLSDAGAARIGRAVRVTRESIDEFIAKGGAR